MLITAFAILAMNTNAYAINYTTNQKIETFEVVIKKTTEHDYANIAETKGQDSDGKTRIILRQATSALGTVYFYGLYNTEGNAIYRSEAFEIDISDYSRLSQYLRYTQHNCNIVLSINSKNYKLEEIKANCSKWY